MSSLTKRVDALEQASGIGQTRLLWVEYASDGGLVHDGKFYVDADALCRALGCEPGGVRPVGWTASQTAAELLTGSEVSLDEIAAYVQLLKDEYAAQGRELRPDKCKDIQAKLNAMTPEERKEEARRLFCLQTGRKNIPAQ